MDDALRQAAVIKSSLKTDFVAQKFGIGGIEQRIQALGFARPPGGVARVGHLLREVGTGQVHGGEHGAGGAALLGGGAGSVAAGQTADNARRLARQRTVHAAVAPRHRLRAGYAAAAQMAGEFHKKRQLLLRQHFEHRQHIAAAVGIEKIIAVGNPLRDAVQRFECAQRIVSKENAHFVVGNAGIDGHGRQPENRKSADNSKFPLFRQPESVRGGFQTAFLPAAGASVFSALPRRSRSAGLRAHAGLPAKAVCR